MVKNLDVILVNGFFGKVIEFMDLEIYFCYEALINDLFMFLEKFEIWVENFLKLKVVMERE